MILGTGVPLVFVVVRSFVRPGAPPPWLLVPGALWVGSSFLARAPGTWRPPPWHAPGTLFAPGTPPLAQGLWVGSSLLAHRGRSWKPRTAPMLA